MPEYKIKKCNKHGETKFRKEGKDTKWERWRCVKCSSFAVSKRRKKLKEELVKYKDGKCEMCGYNKCIDALEFHHKDPNEKDFGIASNGHTRSFDQLKTEVDKCLLVCANCHREIHAKESS